MQLKKVIGLVMSLGLAKGGMVDMDKNETFWIKCIEGPQHKEFSNSERLSPVEANPTKWVAVLLDHQAVCGEKTFAQNYEVALQLKQLAREMKEDNINMHVRLIGEKGADQCQEDVLFDEGREDQFENDAQICSDKFVANQRNHISDKAIIYESMLAMVNELKPYTESHPTQVIVASSRVPASCDLAGFAKYCSIFRSALGDKANTMQDVPCKNYNYLHHREADRALGHAYLSTPNLSLAILHDSKINPNILDSWKNDHQKPIIGSKRYSYNGAGDLVNALRVAIHNAKWIRPVPRCIIQ